MFVLGACTFFTRSSKTRHTRAVDIDVHALERRKTKVRDVDEVRVGDLRTPTLFAPASFDVIYNSFVLEHIDGAEQVLDHFLSWLVPGGLLILRVPDRDSVYGFLSHAHQPVLGACSLQEIRARYTRRRTAWSWSLSDLSR
jgi:2-polyprenyl-3-methyl-5-hydroxy-6-metoxy-1,4-benzoquinol methylase